jgi:type VI secretion system secreted protein VgrG
VLFTAGGAYIKLGANGGNDIEIHAPGMVEFKASMKSWAGAKSDSNSLELAKADLKGCSQKDAKGLDAIGDF